MENEILSFSAQKRISSLEIAIWAGKKHNNVMRDIRIMEPAWVGLGGLKFELSSYTTSQNKVLPCYSLTGEQMLFVITKFDDVARAKLIKRWMLLEQSEHDRLAKQLHVNQEYADYTREVLNARGSYSTTEVAKELGLTARRLNQILNLRGVIFKQPRGRSWVLYAKYDEMGLIEYETRVYQSANGRKYTKRYERWSEKGRHLICQMVDDHTNFRPLTVLPKYVELTIAFPIN